MAPNPKAEMAFSAMRDLGIPEETVRPVLRNLLKLYDKNWELIEEENYRALADAIFDYEETKAMEEKKKYENINRVEDKKKEAQMHDESENPLKRLRLRHREDQVSPSVGISDAVLGETSLVRSKIEEAAKTSELHLGDKRAKPVPVSSRRHLRVKGKEPVLSQTSPVQERAGASQLCLRERRSESNSITPPTHLRDKGKEPISPQIAPRETRSVSGRSSHVVYFKEPKVEPGTVLLPKRKVPSIHDDDSLINPKSEPFTDDLPQFEVPIAMIHPALPYPSCKEGSSIGNDSMRQADGMKSMASQNVDAEDKGDGVSDSACKTGTNYEIVHSSEAYANFEIASSPLGEVKISMSCNSALKRPDFHMPCLNAVLKLVEDKCLKPYRSIEPSFSLMKLMNALCECFLEMGTESTVNKQERSENIMPTLDLLKKSNANNVLKARGVHLDNFCSPGSSSNELLNFQSSMVNLPHIPRLLSLIGLDGLNPRIQPNKKVVRNSNGERDKKRKESKGSGCSNSHSLVAVQQHGTIHDVNDITKGEERVKISLVNEINNQFPPNFYYIPKNAVYQNAYVNFSLARIGDEDCCSHCFGDCMSSSIPCACARETGGEFAYTDEGLVKEEFLKECMSMNHEPQHHRTFYCKDCPHERSKNEDVPDPCKGHLVRKFIKECWSKCGCNKQCGNRVVQRGIACNLQVFFTSKRKGWGLRTLEDLPMGAFVCEYVGEILTNTELYERNIRSTGNEKHTYPVLLDADWGSERVLKDEEALCLDATIYGNVARFINHRCHDGNLIEIPVEVETPDHHYYHVAFFTTRKVDALEELTWDYCIDFDDHNHPVKAFRCCCGSKFCRDMKNSNRTKSSAFVLG